LAALRNSASKRQPCQQGGGEAGPARDRYFGSLLTPFAFAFSWLNRFRRPGAFRFAFARLASVARRRAFAVAFPRLIALTSPGTIPFASFWLIAFTRRGAVTIASSRLIAFASWPVSVAPSRRFTVPNDGSHPFTASWLLAFESATHPFRIPLPRFLELFEGWFERRIGREDRRVLGVAECFHGVTHRGLGDPNIVVRHRLLLRRAKFFAFFRREGIEAASGAGLRPAFASIRAPALGFRLVGTCGSYVTEGYGKAGCEGQGFRVHGGSGVVDSGNGKRPRLAGEVTHRFPRTSTSGFAGGSAMHPAAPEAKSPAHQPACFQMNTGFTLADFPSIGAWLSYGLGPESDELPVFVVLPDPRGLVNGGTANWSNGFLPAEHQGTTFNMSAAEPVANLVTPPDFLPAAREAGMKWLAQLNGDYAARNPGDSSSAVCVSSRFATAEHWDRRGSIGTATKT
jgi:hypothetical protein